MILIVHWFAFTGFSFQMGGAAQISRLRDAQSAQGWARPACRVQVLSTVLAVSARSGFVEGLPLLAPGADVAAIVEHLPAGAECFRDIPLEPGAVIGNAATLLVTALHVPPELDIARAIRIADVTEKECAICHEP
jgi:hypothetical protein